MFHIISSGWLFEFVRCVVGEDSSVYFLEDWWMDEKPLRELFPCLYHLSSEKLHFVVFILPSFRLPSLLLLGSSAILSINVLKGTLRRRGQVWHGGAHKKVRVIP